MPRTTHTPDTDTPTYTPRPVDAIHEAIARLNVVRRMLIEHECNRNEDAAADDCDGYDLTVARELLTEIRDLLSRSVQTDRSASHAAQS